MSEIPAHIGHVFAIFSLVRSINRHAFDNRSDWWIVLCTSGTEMTHASWNCEEPFPIISRKNRDLRILANLDSITWNLAN